MWTSRQRVKLPARRVATWDLRRAPVGTVLDGGGFVALASIGLALGVLFATGQLFAIDSTTFWDAGHSPHYYDAEWTCVGRCSYLYPPPVAQLTGLVPWYGFIIPWTVLVFVGWWVATRLWSLPTFIGSVVVVAVIGHGNPLSNVLDQTAIGNPQILIAAVCVIGFRYPAAWALVLLTKIAPGVGILWFVMRREWRNLGIVIAATAGIVAISLVLAPGAWLDYLRFITANANATSPEPVVAIPFIMRFPMSVALVTWGALSNHRWTVPIAVGWASLALYEWTFMSIWIAALVLVERPTWHMHHWTLRRMVRSHSM